GMPVVDVTATGQDTAGELPLAGGVVPVFHPQPVAQGGVVRMGDVAHGINVVGGAQLLIHPHAAIDREAGSFGQVEIRCGTHGHHHGVGGQCLTIDAHAGGVVGAFDGDRGAGTQGDAVA